MASKKQTNLGGQDVVSAQVVLRSASGKSLRTGEAISAKNIQDYVPSPETASKIKKAFSDSGFEVGPVVGNSFSIAAPVETFERVFSAHLQIDERGGLKSVSGAQPASLELPLKGLSKTIRDNVEAVTFTPPPDFGPAGSGP